MTLVHHSSDFETPVSHDAALADFGLGKRLDDRSSTPGRLYGPLLALAPEVLSGEKYEQPADVYSYGRLVWQLLLLWLQLKGQQSIPKLLLETVCKCVTYGKAARPPMLTVLKSLESLSDQIYSYPQDVEYVNEAQGMEEVERILHLNPQHCEAGTSSSDFGSLSLW